MIQQQKQNRSRERYEAVFVELMKHPGRWALLAEDEIVSNLVRLRERKNPLGFEFVARGTTKNGTVGKLYARYRPDAETPDIPQVTWADPPPTASEERTRRIKVVTEYALAHPEASLATIARHFEIHPNTVRRYLN